VLRANPDLFEKRYPKVQAGEKTLLSNLTAGGEAGASGKNPVVQTGEGDETNIVKLADKIQGEQKCDRDTAFVLAEKQIKARSAGR
jgi:hypothetical protein